MRVQATKTMAREIKKQTGFSATLEKFSPERYEVIVDYDLLANEEDYNWGDRLFSAIRIDYPAEFYAIPRYLSTRDLRRIFRESDKTFNGFFEAVKNAIEI